MKNQKTATKAKSVDSKVAAKTAAPVVSAPTLVPNASHEGVAKMILTLKKTKTNKAGEVYFSFGAGSVRFSKSAFLAGAEAPAEVNLEVPEGVFAPAGVVRTGGGGGSRIPSPEKLAKLQANAQKAADRAKKAMEKANKALKAAGVATPPVETAEPVTA